MSFRNQRIKRKTISQLPALKESYLSVFVQGASKEAVGVGESLRASTLPHTDHSVLLRVQDAALKTNKHTLGCNYRISDSGLERQMH